MTAATVGTGTMFDNDGKSVNVDLKYTVVAKQVVYADGFLGISVEGGDSGKSIALTIDQRAYQFTVPHSLNVKKGNTVYITVANVTGHTPNDNAYTLSSGAGNVALFHAEEDQDSNDVVTGILLPR